MWKSTEMQCFEDIFRKAPWLLGMRMFTLQGPKAPGSFFLSDYLFR